MSIAPDTSRPTPDRLAPTLLRGSQPVTFPHKSVGTRNNNLLVGSLESGVWS